MERSTAITLLFSTILFNVALCQSMNERRSIFQAIRDGDERATELLIRNGANVIAEDELEKSPIQYAVKYGHAKIVELLIRNGAKVNVGIETPIHTAARLGYDKVVAILIRNGADVNDANNKWRMSPLHEALLDGDYLSPLSAYLGGETTYQTADHVKVVELLIQNGANVSAKGGKQNEPPLYYAVKIKNEKFTELLVQNGANVTVEFKDKLTPLHVAAENENEKVAQILVRSGANVNVEDRLRRTPMHLAAKSANPKVVEYLIKYGGNVNAEDHAKMTPLHYTAEFCQLFYAPAYSQIEDIVTMLINNGVWIHHKNFRRQTALDTAVENKCHGKLIELLRQAETKSSASNPHQLLFK